MTNFNITIQKWYVPPKLILFTFTKNVPATVVYVQLTFIQDVEVHREIAIYFEGAPHCSHSLFYCEQERMRATCP